MKHSSCAILLAFFLIGGTKQAQAADIVDTAVKAGNFKTLVAAVKAAELVKTLKSYGPFTVFAPSDEAFAKLPKQSLKDLLKPNAKGKLSSILTYHVVPGRVLAKDAFGLNEAVTVNGQKLKISKTSSGLKIGNARVIATDIKCDNGVIHVIDSVLMPETRSIPEVATEAGVFNTLLTAVTKAELANTLSFDGPFTVFAPTDDAFAKLPAGTVATLLKPENRDQLMRILTYHVISGRVFAVDAVKAEKARTLQGQSVKINVGAQGVKINDAKLVQADVGAANGVIHIIDSVLLPKTLSPSEARQLLERAVEVGSIAFNNGDAHKCYTVYKQAAEQIIEAGATLPKSVQITLKESLRRAKTHKKDVDSAWILRHGIDLSYHALQ